MAAIVYMACLTASLWFAWRGAWTLFRVVYMLAWALVAGAWLYVLGSNHGVHGSPGYMIAWGLAFLLPLLFFANLLTGFLAFVAGAVGSRRRATTDEASG